ncbi:MAG: hypothetical protein IPO25_18585 [Saprospiraceae bacterium]|nr:hypothetical protein [Saprospiraceae bacterium]
MILKNYYSSPVGVTYESGAGDYAEWLPKADSEESFLPGYIVGLKYGKISKKIDAASKLMVISTKPIVLGNTPAEKAKTNYEKVAFLGQVPVHVVGKVQAGDYILPSGLNDGLGIAIDPSKLQVEDYPRIVGVAWTASDEEGYKMINVAVGLNGRAINKFVVDQKNKIEELKQKIAKRNRILATLVPGYSESLTPGQNESASQSLESHIRLKVFLNENKLDVSRDFISDLLAKAEKISTTYNNNPEAEQFWGLLKSDSNYRDQFIGNIQSEIQKNFQSN